MSHLSDKELIDELKIRFSQREKTLKEVSDLNNELKKVNRKLEDSEALKSHFISNITNEIVNPFSSILALSNNILSVKKENWKKVFSMVSMIYTEAFNLDFQLRNIFVAAKIEAGEVFPEIMNVDIKQLTESVIEAFKHENKKKKLIINLNFDIQLKKDDDVFLFKTDAEKIKLIISNLLSNAIKYSNVKGKIEIKISKNNNELELSIKDYGTGISKENREIIFDRFKRLDSGINSINRGHGLGLSIVKGLIDLLNGTIDIKSQINKGACFIVCIPEKESDIEGFAANGNEMFFDENMDKDDEQVF
ncbi:MAG: HAMP domain-containing sensor histidine kinase [Bacteroidales bacterium]|jgi:signal transduction histidine kinase|nr:HAMP domain-containing sensor histidine kinase [Bacteroidales bacterium]